MATEFKVPDLGENIESADVINVLVSKGDTIEKDQPVLEIETDKAAVEVPSNVSGTVQEVHVSSGDTIKVGQVILTLDADGAGAKADTSDKEEAAESEADDKAKTEQKESAPKEETAKKEEKPDTAESEKPKPPRDRRPSQQDRSSEAVKLTPVDKLVPAAPTVRRFAREIGIDIAQVPGSGPGGRISIDDVKSFSRKERATGGGVGLGHITAETLPDFEKWGEIERKSMSNVRRKTAEHLSYAWATIPHVTQHDRADITELEKLRKAFGKQTEAAGGKLTVTAILLKVCAAALKVFPQFNASVDMAKKELIYKKYINIGVAVDTERGLLVPVVRDVAQKNILELAVELTEISKKARDGKLTLEEMQGGNFTISNLGGIGGTAFTPVVNSPEVAILGVSRSSFEPVYQDGDFVPRLMMPLSLSYDHRIIDGADVARFTRWLAEALEQPFKLVFEG